MRKSIYVTPKSYLSFIGFYKNLYLTKFKKAKYKETSFKIGLQKIKEATEEIKNMGEELKVK